MSSLLLIKEGMSSFTKTQAGLAGFLLEHPEKALQMNARELAQACACSSAAVIRFAQKLGFKGFTQLRLDLALDLGIQEAADFETVIWDHDPLDMVVKKAEQIHLHNTGQTYAMVNLHTLTEAIEALCTGARIHLFGIGASGLLAKDFQHKASRLGFHAFYHSDAHTNLATAALLNQEDVVLAISYSGETREVLLAVRSAKEWGCKVIAITQANGNPLAALADYPLYIPGEESKLRIAAMTSRISGLLILDLLYLGMAGQNPDQTRENLEKTKALICNLHGK